MASKAVLDAVRTRQAALWTTVPVYYPNEAGKAPDALTPFVQVETPIGRRRTLSMGPTRGYEEEGGIRFVVHVPIITDFDDEVAFTYADQLVALFLGKDLLPGLETGAAGPVIPQGDDGAYYKVSVVIPYRYRFRA